MAKKNKAEPKKGEASAPNPQGQSDLLQSPVDHDERARMKFPVVAIGASAGGLEAFCELFHSLPADTGMAFVLIQHLPPRRESLLTEILQTKTAMPVNEVRDGMAIQPNHVYVIRPGHTMTMCNGKLRLGEPVEKPGHSRPVDDFFRSLAEELQERAIVVVMSGMGSNGTAGAEAVKAVGGMCIAQDPASAKYPIMPQSLIDANLADFVLRPQEIPLAIARYARHPHVSGERSAEAILRHDRQQFNEIIAILRTQKRHDFSGYKKPTLLRRIQRRMGLNQITELSDYARLLREDPGEVTSLCDDLMIHVTGFFRDAEAWELLREQVVVPLMHKKEQGSAIRAWVAACSSGQEAYTLAMLLVEVADSLGKSFDIKIFATDTASGSLSHARAGVYPGGIESELSVERLNRFFEKEDSTYRIKKSLRELVVFAPQNILQDPPFSRLDIATCRNLLIYLEPEVQKRLIALLHFGLREGGALMLGNSETVSDGAELFETIDRKWRIFRRSNSTRHGTINFAAEGVMASLERGGDSAVQRTLGRDTVAQVAQQILLEHLTPAAVVVDSEYHVAYFHGATDAFLKHPAGAPTRELLGLARESVRGAIRTALQKAAAQKTNVRVRGGVIEKEQGRHRVEVLVTPLEQGVASGHFLVSFHEHPEPPPSPDSDKDTTIDRRQLEEELLRVQDELKSTIQELQVSNEEMKASNEEITSINEELQSTNEELETSKEELQSLNEELTTVNAQLQSKMKVLEATTNDLSSLLSSTDIAVVFLDTRFRIRWFTPAVRDLLELIPTDIGRPISDLSRKFTDVDLLGDAQCVLDRLAQQEKEVSSDSGRWYLRRILPYRTADNRIDGVVITFVNITDRKNAEQALETLRQSEKNGTGSQQ